VLSFEQWQSKSKSSLAAARVLLEHDQPVEAASRTYYAAYQMVTGVLLRLKLNPRNDLGNWAHRDTVEMYRIHICHKADLQLKEVCYEDCEDGFSLKSLNRESIKNGAEIQKPVDKKIAHLPNCVGKAGERKYDRTAS
jgi:hypothetical protein